MLVFLQKWEAVRVGCSTAIGLCFKCFQFMIILLTRNAWHLQHNKKAFVLDLEVSCNYQHYLQVLLVSISGIPLEYTADSLQFNKDAFFEYIGCWELSRKRYTKTQRKFKFSSSFDHKKHFVDESLLTNHKWILKLLDFDDQS